MSESNIKNIMETTMEKIRAMVDADTVIGDPIVVDGTTIIPISKVSFGLATGGSDFGGKGNSPMFGGGGGAGMSIVPVAFMVIRAGEVKMLQIYKDETAANKAIGILPELFDKISALFKKQEEIEIDNI